VRNEDLSSFAIPLFILNGEAEQLQPMKEIAVAIGIPEEKLYLLSCGNRGAGNTRTQFTQIMNSPDLKSRSHFIVVTSAYHVSRVARTAKKHLPEFVDFEVFGVPFKDFSFSVFRKVKGEVKRILSYSRKGDIAEDVRRK